MCPPERRRHVLLGEIQLRWFVCVAVQFDSGPLQTVFRMLHRMQPVLSTTPNTNPFPSHQILISDGTYAGIIQFVHWCPAIASCQRATFIITLCSRSLTNLCVWLFFSDTPVFSAGLCESEAPQSVWRTTQQPTAGGVHSGCY